MKLSRFALVVKVLLWGTPWIGTPTQKCREARKRATKELWVWLSPSKEEVRQITSRVMTERKMKIESPCSSQKTWHILPLFDPGMETHTGEDNDCETSPWDLPGKLNPEKLLNKINKNLTSILLGLADFWTASLSRHSAHLCAWQTVQNYNLENE